MFVIIKLNNANSSFVPENVLLLKHRNVLPLNPVITRESQRKQGHFIHAHNFGKCWSIFKTLSLSNSVIM